MKVKNGIASSSSFCDDPEDAQRQVGHERSGKNPSATDETAEADAQRRQREGDREADQHDHDQAAEHDRRRVAHRDHCSGFS